MAARPLQIKEPGLVRRVLPGEPDCELEVHETAVDRIDIVIVEEEVGLVRRRIIDVSHLPGGGEAAVGIIFADEDVTVINDPGGIEVIYFDAVTLRIVEVQDQVLLRNGRRLSFLRTRYRRPISTRSSLCRSHPQGREPG
jgi:hypothetical protein